MAKGNYNLCIIKPNKSSFSETFIQAHIDRLAGNKFVLYGGAFPVYDNEGNFLIKSKFGFIVYLLQKRLFKNDDIAIRNNALAWYFKKEKIDVVLAEYGMVGAMIATACKIANVPLVIHYHGADVHHHKTVARYFTFYKKSFDYAKALIAVSTDMLNELRKLGAPAEKLILNPYGVDTAKFSQVNVRKSGRIFLYVGRFVEKKSPSSLINVFSIIANKFDDAKLWMVGTGPLLEDTKQIVFKLGLKDKVVFYGVLTPNEIYALMQQARCFVQHSVTAGDGDMEGTPNSILEASSAGLPIVSTLHAGIKEAVIDHVTGFLTNEHDIEGMAAGMIKIADSPELAAKLGTAGREHIMKNYDINLRIFSLDNIIQNSIN